MGEPRIKVPEKQLAKFCERHHITRLSLFGSVLRDDFGPESDIDVLVEFDPEHMPGWEIVDVSDELSALLGGHRIDLVNPKYLNPRLKHRILESAVLQYEAAHET
jgi:predicted nucleotidyltransferase